MKNIIHIGPNGNGGISTVINNILNSPLKEKYNLYFLITQYDKLNIIQTIKSYFKLKKMFKDKLVDLVHIHMASNGSYYRKSLFINLCKKSNIPVVLHVHGAYFKEFYFKLNDFQKKKMKKVFSKCDAVIGLTKDWKKFLIDLIGDFKKVKIVSNFVEIPSKYSIPNNLIPNIIFLGRIGERKGTFDLLKALKKLRDDKIKFNATIAGDGEIDKCRSFIEKNELTNVRCLGWIDFKERNEILLKADILILPSYYESFGMVLIEAMSYKVPVIGGNAGSIPNVITNNSDGLLVEPGNIDDIKEKLLFLINNPKIRIKMGEEGFKKVCIQYSPNEFSKKIDNIYKEILYDNHKLKSEK